MKAGVGRKIAKGFRFVFIGFGVLGLFGALLMGLYTFWFVGNFALVMALVDEVRRQRGRISS